MYFLPLYFPIVVVVSLALKDSTDSDLSVFKDDLPGSSALGFDLNSNDLFASNEQPLNDEFSTPATDNLLDLNSISLQLDEDESSPSLFVAADDCSSNNNNNRLGKRDGKGSSCFINNNNQFKTPQFPTLDQLMNTIVPGDTSEQQQEETTEQPIWINEDDRRCLPEQPFFLCCLCNPTFTLMVCQDCLPSKAFCPSSMRPAIEIRVLNH